MWTLNVRFPDALRSEVDKVLATLNGRPDRIGDISKNDLIVFAVQRLCKDILAEDGKGEPSVNTEKEGLS